MAKKKQEVIEEVTESVETPKEEILPITETFGSGDLNTLRDKINEIISKR